MNTLLALILLVLPVMETPHGVPAHPGPAGETGRYALTPAVRQDRGRELRQRGIPVTDEAIALAQLEWIARGLKRARQPADAYHIALAWNCGLARTLRGRAPRVSHDYAARLVNLVELELEKQKTMNSSPITAGALTPYHVVARTVGLEQWALAKLEPSDFRRAENIEHLAGQPHLTTRGVMALALAAEKRGYRAMAHSLRVLARQAAEKPSRPQLKPLAKGASPARFHWQSRADLA